MDEPIWSRLLARQVAQTLGYRVPGNAAATGYLDFGPEAQRLTDEITEAFRYLAAPQVRCVFDFAEFLQAHRVNGAAPAVLRSLVPEKLGEVRDLAVALRQRYGASQPHDEKDYWTDEDERDLTAMTFRRLEEEDPWPEDDIYPTKEQGNAQTG